MNKGLLWKAGFASRWEAIYQSLYHAYETYMLYVRICICVRVCVSVCVCMDACMYLVSSWADSTQTPPVLTPPASLKHPPKDREEMP